MSIQVGLIPVTPFQQNCALIWDSETMEASIIDPGGEVPGILAAIAETKANVTSIYITHGHLDHAGGAAELAEALGIQVTGPGSEDAFLMKGMAKQGAQYGIDARDCVPDKWLAEGDKVRIGGAEFDVLHCPGHTPGHLVFINRGQKFGIMGDVLFRNSVGRTDFPYGNTEQLITTIKTKLMVLPDDFNFICGHGQSSSIGAERRSNPFVR